MTQLKLLRLTKVLAIWTLLTNLTSCFPSKSVKVLSNYCYIYVPLNTNLEKDVVDYWYDQQQIILGKNKLGETKTASEKFIEIMIDSVGSNDKRYYDKECDKV